MPEDQTGLVREPLVWYWRCVYQRTQARMLCIMMKCVDYWHISWGVVILRCDGRDWIETKARVRVVCKYLVNMPFALELYFTALASCSHLLVEWHLGISSSYQNCSLKLAGELGNHYMFLGSSEASSSLASLYPLSALCFCNVTP